MSNQTAIDSILTQLAGAPEWERVLARNPVLEGDISLVTEVVQAAGAFAEDLIAPFDRAADAVGCGLKAGRVSLAPGHREVWDAFVAAGWPTIDGPVCAGGMGLPHAVHSACEELFNRASTSFGMLPTPIRCAALVIDKYAEPALKDEWLPRLVTGEWGATICISEADAGSDVPRLRTAASLSDDGSWSLSGEKMWISFGDHDLTSRIGHMVLARTQSVSTGSAGLSLFLVPSTRDDGSRNSVSVRRIEEKLGLHASPTCELGFDHAQGWLIGELDRGLSQLFTMIVGMRLSVGSQGAGIAGAAADIALSYASERKQGGPSDQPPVTINNHGDVRRILLETAARAEMARGLVLTAALMADLEHMEESQEDRDEAANLLAWMLPITKNFCAESASICASNAIQVLGGAGFTREWRAEQLLRDARVLSIYEGTSGMQALDLVLRRVLGKGAGAMASFLRVVHRDIEAAADKDAAAQLEDIVDLLNVSAKNLVQDNISAIAYPFLQVASYATTGWIALRLCGMSGDPVSDRLAALGRHWLLVARPLARAEAELVAQGGKLIANFELLDTAACG